MDVRTAANLAAKLAVGCRAYIATARPACCKSRSGRCWWLN